MSLELLREKIDKVDNELTRLFEERMTISGEIANYKREKNLPVLDRTREAAKLKEISEKISPEFEPYAHILYDMIFELSRSYQGSRQEQGSELYMQIQDAISASTNKPFPTNASVACQGVSGAFSQHAAEKLFRRPAIGYFKTFDSVFSAIESGFYEYGVLPLENSTAGSVTKIYSLMQSRDFKIVRSIRLKIDHNLLVKKGVKLEDVREVFSHEQAISQCAGFLEKLGENVKITTCENTAAAAEMVANSERDDVAAICSVSCLDLYNLDCIASDIQDHASNYTRFICISKNLEIYPGADRTSILMVLPHQPGSLYKALSKFYSLGINLIKLESRPIPERDFQFMFYFDLETSVYSEEFAKLLEHMQEICQEFKYLGSYSEVI